MRISQSIAAILRNHVTVKVKGIDRMYLHVQGRGIEVAQGLEPLLVAGGVRLVDDVGHSQVLQVQGMMHGDVFEGMGNSQEGGTAPRRRAIAHEMGRSAMLRSLAFSFPLRRALCYMVNSGYFGWRTISMRR